VVTEDVFSGLSKPALLPNMPNTGARYQLVD
jgi:hypothetical protein